MTEESKARSTTEVAIAETQLGPVRETMLRCSEPNGGLPELDLAAASRSTGRSFTVLREIGRGGMGVVHLAEQASLGREVALKTAPADSRAIRSALVREARLMGALEHPNLVPVHELGVDAEGAPILVMKRVEGVSWRELLDDPEHAGWQSLVVGHGDRLRANVDILIAVSRALAFAHDRGVVHRDLKPDNVMIGRFGEVYLLDWGIALRLSERALEPEGVVGTPAYLAPEMARGDPKSIDARTDVYLLGATLFEVLAGTPPHMRAAEGAAMPSAQAAIEHALAGEIPDAPESAPAELVALVKRAMARDPSDRLASAEAFREGLAHYLVTREADVVAEKARAALARAEEAMKMEGAASAHAFRSLVEARFGFATARGMRPDDASLLAGLDAATLALVEREIALRSPDAARALLADLDDAPASLDARIAELEAAIAQERAAAEDAAKARRAADLTLAARPFTIGALAYMGFALVVGSLFVPKAAASDHGFPVRDAVIFDWCLLAVFFLPLLIWRKRIFATAGSARLAMIWIVTGCAVMVSEMATFGMGRTTIDATVHTAVACGTVSAMTAIFVGRIYWLATIAWSLCVAAMFLAPRFGPVFALLAGVMTISIWVRAFRAQGARRS